MTSPRIVGLVLLVLAAGPALHAQRELPPVSYVCPMSEHSQVLEDKPGKCPLCQMTLVPVRIEQAYACPNHPAVISEKPGLCPLDKRDLMPVTVNLYWTCRENPTEHLTEPGRCANGAARAAVREDRAHGDHNPRHGGQFFMAADKWHHVEATHPRAGVLRVYFYDNFTKAIPPKGFTGRAVTNETFDAATRQTREIEVAPLRASADGRTLEARINARALPAKVTVKLKFDPRLPEERFDFAFESYSKEPEPAPATTTTRTAPRPAPVAIVAPAAPVSPVAPVSSSFGTEVGGTVMAGTAKDLLALLAARHAEIKDLIDRGQFAAVYVPALLAKDVALALDTHGTELPDQRRLLAQTAIRRLVIAAWQLDSFGDLGDADKVTGAYRALASAVTDLMTAYGIAR